MYSTLSYYVTIGQRWPNSIGLCPFLIGKPSVIRAGLHFPILPLAPGSPKKQALQIIYHPSSLTFSLLREKASTEQPLSLPLPCPIGIAVPAIRLRDQALLCQVLQERNVP